MTLQYTVIYCLLLVNIATDVDADSTCSLHQSLVRVKCVNPGFTNAVVALRNLGNPQQNVNREKALGLAATAVFKIS